MVRGCTGTLSCSISEHATDCQYPVQGSPLMFGTRLAPTPVLLVSVMSWVRRGAGSSIGWAPPSDASPPIAGTQSPEFGSATWPGAHSPSPVRGCAAGWGSGSRRDRAPAFGVRRGRPVEAAGHRDGDQRRREHACGDELAGKGKSFDFMALVNSVLGLEGSSAGLRQEYFRSRGSMDRTCSSSE